jgi:glycosyltransferase involved in cell wall biosynthesis
MRKGKIQVRLIPQFPFPIMTGGLEVQCLETCDALGKAGISARLLDPYSMDDRFDILHLFGPGLGAYDIVGQLGHRRPVVISALFGASHVATLRTSAKKVVSIVAAFARQGTFYSMMRDVFASAAWVICLNPLEGAYLRQTYGVTSQRVSIVPNGVADRFFTATPDSFRDRYQVNDFVLFVGSIIPRKNPLKLARVLAALRHPGVFIGRRVGAEMEYARQFELVIQANPQLIWIQDMRHDDPVLASAYASARVFILPSYAETQSLSALESMATGTPLVLGDRPYAYQPPFQDARRIDPDSDDSMKRALVAALSGDTKNSGLPDEYRWPRVAEKIAEIYGRVLST